LPIEANISQNNKAKLQKGIFVVPQIKQIFEDQNFSTKLNATERKAGEAFENICRDFLSNKKVENCSENVQELISLYSAICATSLNLHFLLSHKIFPASKGAVFDEHGKWFCQDFSQMENGVQIYWLMLLESYKRETNWRM
jgi:hypothetical protein